MLHDLLRTWWAEPRAEGAPRRVWRDWVLVALAVVGVLLEGTLTRDLPWRPVAVVMGVGLAFTVLWRRQRPLAMVGLSFGTVIAVDLASVAVGSGGAVGLGAMVYLLVLVYAVFRWGSGREILLALPLLAVAFTLGITLDDAPLVDTIAGGVFLSFPAVIGVTVRFWRTSRARELDQLRLRERQDLARELHDTVAHHVSAIVIGAQAGRVVAATRPGAAVEALEAIEEEGARTLEEMRAMVGALRDGAAPELAPPAGVGDLERLVTAPSDGVAIELRLTGRLDDLAPSVDAAVYRIVQESVTNARRHARGAGTVLVRVDGERDDVRIGVVDDGSPLPRTRPREGYGITGMRERAELLGGTFEAGPGESQGWVVTAVLPRKARTA